MQHALTRNLGGAHRKSVDLWERLLVIIDRRAWQSLWMVRVDGILSATITYSPGLSTSCVSMRTGQ